MSFSHVLKKNDLKDFSEIFQFNPIKIKCLPNPYILYTSRDNFNIFFLAMKLSQKFNSDLFQKDFLKYLRFSGLFLGSDLGCRR